MKCPECNGIVMSTFDSNGFIVNKCINPDCLYEFYSKDKLQVVKENEAKQRWLNSFSMRRENILQDKISFIVVSYLKEIREYRGISQKQIAELLGFSEQRYGSIERHYNAPSIVLVSSIAAILSVPVTDIYRVVEIPRDLYDKMKNMNIEIIDGKVEFKVDKELRKIEKSLTEEIAKYEVLIESASEKKKAESKKKISELYKESGKLRRSASVLLKQAEVVEYSNWKKFLEDADVTDIEELDYESVLPKIILNNN